MSGNKYPNKAPGEYNEKEGFGTGIKVIIVFIAVACVFTISVVTVAMMSLKGPNNTIKADNVDDEAGKEVESNNELDEYILPNSNTEYLLNSELWELAEKEDPKIIRLAIDEIYARHGLVFKDDYNKRYFNSVSWYSPNSELQSESQVEPHLNVVESSNIKSLLELEEELRGENKSEEKASNKTAEPRVDTSSQVSSKKIYYRVVVDGFGNKLDAEDLRVFLNSYGFNSFIIGPNTPDSVRGREYQYCVLSGSYTSLENAQDQIWKLQNLGFYPEIVTYEK